VYSSIDVNVRMSGTFDNTPDLAIHFPDGSTDSSPTLAEIGPSEYATTLYDFETLHGETTYRVTASQDGQSAEKSTVAKYVYPHVEIEEPPRLSPLEVCADPDNDYRLTGDLQVAMDVKGLLVDDTVTVITHGGDGESFEASHEGVSGTWDEAEHIGSEFAVTLPEGLQTPPGDDNRPRLEIEALREFDLATDTVLADIPLCEETTN
jgi:hypothetical protein